MFRLAIAGGLVPILVPAQFRWKVLSCKPPVASTFHVTVCYLDVPVDWSSRFTEEKRILSSSLREAISAVLNAEIFHVNTWFEIRCGIRCCFSVSLNMEHKGANTLSLFQLHPTRCSMRGWIPKACVMDIQCRKEHCWVLEARQGNATCLFKDIL